MQPFLAVFLDHILCTWTHIHTIVLSVQVYIPQATSKREFHHHPRGIAQATKATVYPSVKIPIVHYSTYVDDYVLMHEGKHDQIGSD